MGANVLWFRRDLRLSDHPALAAAASAGEVAPLFVIDPVLWSGSGPLRRAWLAANLRALMEHLPVSVRVGDPVSVVAEFAREVDASSVHVSTETTPYGRQRDLAGSALHETGSAYAVTPGRVKKADGSPYLVFTPWSRAWRAHSWPRPATYSRLSVSSARSDPQALAMLDAAIEASPIALPEPGEEAALKRWHQVLGGLERYGALRDRPDLDGTSQLSPYLKVGAIHPRTLLADLDLTLPGHQVVATELAWREFYADVLSRHPNSAWADLKPLPIEYDDDPAALTLWQTGRTGFPIVDAGMRQMLATGWMHNRVRMIVASFLCKDLHIWWPAGARWFMEHLIDGDIASNSHGWQWVAGTGTDASPYFRIFNPTTQGLRFDPEGDYVRRWVPELAHLPGKRAHEPWKQPDGYAHNYPEPMVDHDVERRESLRRYEAARSAQRE